MIPKSQNEQLQKTYNEYIIYIDKLNEDIEFNKYGLRQSKNTNNDLMIRYYTKQLELLKLELEFSKNMANECKKGLCGGKYEEFILRERKTKKFTKPAVIKRKK